MFVIVTEGPLLSTYSCLSAAAHSVIQTHGQHYPFFAQISKSLPALIGDSPVCHLLEFPDSWPPVLYLWL